ncbi:MAG: hypothetical protein M3537_03275 [Chloroflexota bacterium]|nr:hypothetical protein [Chloroflexota bacterium]
MTRLQVAEIPAILVVHDPDSVALLVGRSTSLPWWKVAGTDEGDQVGCESNRRY